ncbi:RHS repeat-associated core domain-containing protein [Sphingobacterium spiritivorum]|uniref:RHS repeat-associated core domain-containing protein n=1 Tax=Sphingobacterium spiritivorum TaxID=258 RepID=UPI003DA66DCE
MSKIYSDAGKSVVMLSFVYDESGNRIRKQDHRTGSVTYYSYDAGGSLMAIYDNAGSGGAIRLAEQPVYAANRIGTYYRQAGNYQYTLTDHLGNTRVVINRNKLSNGEADVVYYADYYPFGMVLRSGGVEGRYGYQGQYAEKDGETGWNNFDLRNYDAAIGRWLTVDPYGQYYSPYVGMGNNPVSGVDPDGGFSTWLGAKIWAMFNGGGSISKTDEGIYKVSQSTEHSVRIVGGWSSGLGPVNIPRSYSAPAVRSNFKRDPAYGPWMGGVDLFNTTNKGETQGALQTALPFAMTVASIDGPLPIGDVASAVVVIGAATYDLTQRKYVTYTLTNPATGQIYAGRSSGFGDPYSIMMNRFSGHHMRLMGFGNPQLDRATQGTQSYPAIRGREQQLIDSYGGVGSSNVGNSIRGISKINPFGRFYHSMSNTYFGQIAPFTGY